jgi:putative Holliday junction resolvase
MATGCFLGFDFGLKRMGVAVGQRITQTASPLETLNVEDGIPNWADIKRLVRDWRPEGFVVGVPLNMDDSESKVTLKTRRFIKLLAQEVDLPIYTVDERLTTKAVGYELERLGKKNLKKDDALAACIILESYLMA